MRRKAEKKIAKSGTEQRQKNVATSQRSSMRSSQSRHGDESVRSASSKNSHHSRNSRQEDSVPASVSSDQSTSSRTLDSSKILVEPSPTAPVPRSTPRTLESSTAQSAIVVYRSWTQVKFLEGYKELFGEQVVLHMMKKEPCVRQELGITSLRSSRTDEISQFLVLVVDQIVEFMMVPDLDGFEMELVDLGKQCQDQGIRLGLLSEAVSEAVGLVLCSTAGSDQEGMGGAWKTLFDFAVCRMVPKD